MDEGDVAKFTDAIKEFDSMTRLVCSGTAPMFYFFIQVVGGSFFMDMLGDLSVYYFMLYNCIVCK